MQDGFAGEGLADTWTPVALSREVGKRPFPVQVAGQRLVLFRNAEGKAAALMDRCPHRGVALSLGKVRDGCLECPFHGWRFAADGACAHVPLNPMPPEKLKNFNATSFPVRERAGMVWLYTRPGSEAPEEPVVPEALEDRRMSHWHYVTVFRAHWSRVMENMLDSPHLPFVHRNTIGRILRKQMKEDSTMDVEVHPSPTGWYTQISIDGVVSPGRLSWLRPNGMQLDIPIPGNTWRLHVWCVPHEERSTRLFLLSARSFMRYNPLGWLMDQFNIYIASEDKAVVQSAPDRVPPPSQEKSVATDRATLAFRRWYLQRVQSPQQPEGSLPRAG
ncbi:MAG TPA: aromatic ring-hydroxylating dioxygenase subunit alpha [Archangium sp.]|uniref:aromatic ring-hydroxylating dioxygenase subunit alpha n=1 Tax=Archangium sp. TaxID=1872627 RepID=UPI002E3707C9|nr:aromatic ring-hydroxylating dioxygenase subunit alpha [Archangium sp.]HEX5746785.1 aromatic ring-hydroxylating dioxygenase subunit alpha [Archangium sp.]